MSGEKNNKKSNVKLYALSTCIWCKKTREFLDKKGVEYSYTYVDELEGEEREKVLDELRQLNPKLSFPTLHVNGDKVVVGYDEEKLREALGQ